MSVTKAFLEGVQRDLNRNPTATTVIISRSVLVALVAATLHPKPDN